MAKKSKRGGPRENSGRKRELDNPQTVALQLPGALLEQLDTEAERRGYTCAHARLVIFASEDDMRSAMKDAGIGRSGKRHQMLWGVVGSYTAGGVFSISDRR